MMTPTNRQADVLEAVIYLQQQNPDEAVLIETIAREAGVCWRTAQTHLKTLVATGHLKRKASTNPSGGVGWAYIYRRAYD